MVKLAVLLLAVLAAICVAACASMAHAGSLRNEGVVNDDRLLNPNGRRLGFLKPMTKSNICTGKPGDVTEACDETTWDGHICGVVGIVANPCTWCAIPATYWYGKAATACGKEPCWGSGTICARGTSCNACCGGETVASYWYGKAATACGKEPCWQKDTRCAAGTGCKACCVAATWSWKGFGHFCN
jgi:hypothetical protein